MPHAEDIAADTFAQRLMYQVWRRRDLERACLAALDGDAACAEDRAQRSVSDYMARAVTGLESHTDQMWELAVLTLNLSESPRGNL